MWSGGNHGRSLSSHVCCGSAQLVRSRLRLAEEGTNPRAMHVQSLDTILRGSSISRSGASSTRASSSGPRRSSAAHWSPTSLSLASSQDASGHTEGDSIGASARCRPWDFATGVSWPSLSSLARCTLRPSSSKLRSMCQRPTPYMCFSTGWLRLLSVPPASASWLPLLILACTGNCTNDDCRPR